MMKTKSKKDLRSRMRGAAIPEYIIILAILFPIFVVIGLVLQRESIESATESAGAVNNVVPCGVESLIGAPNPQGTPSIADECK